MRPQGNARQGENRGGVGRSKARRRLIVLGLSLPTAVMAAAYAWLAVKVGTLLLGSQPVHEDGIRNLLATVFYFEHASRELALDWILGIAVGASVLYAYPPRPPAHPEIDRHGTVWPATATLAVTAAVLIGSYLSVGADGLVDNLAQKHTRPGEALRWGAHWRYHAVSRACLIAISMGFAAMAVRFDGRERPCGDLRGWRVFLTSVFLFGVCTLVFVPGVESLLDPRYLGHQARELLTHALVTLPLAWAVCLVVAGTPDESADTAYSTAPTAASAVGITGVAACAWLGWAAASNGAAELAQTDAYAATVGAHFFEHAFSYAVVVCAAALTYRCAVRRSQVAS